MLFTVTEIVLEIVTLGFQDIERLVVPEEFHLRPLAEPCVRLSPHTAPIRRTHR